MNIQNLLAMLIRGFNITSKFILLTFVAKYGNDSDVATFGLYWSAIVLCSTLMGMDVYNFTSRELLTKGTSVIENVEKHFGFILLSASTIPFLALFLFKSNVKVASWIYVIFFFHIIMEFISQESSRLLVPLKKPMLSLVVSFFRSSFWVAPFVIYLVFVGFEFDIINVVVLFWFFGSCISVLISYYLVKETVVGKGCFLLPRFNIPFVVKAIRSSVIILSSSLILRSILSLDKFIINKYFDNEILAIYTVYASVIFSVVSMMEIGVSTWLYPEMVESIKAKDLVLVKVKLRAFFYASLKYSLFLFFLLSIIFPLCVYLFLNEKYLSGMGCFYIMLCSSFFYSLTMPFHYFIYGLSKDINYIFIYGSGLVSMLIWVFCFMEGLGLLGASIMLSVALFTIAFCRIFFTFYLCKKHNWVVS